MDQQKQSLEVDQNFDFFQRHLAAFLPEHRDEYALIRSREIVGFYKKVGDAYREGLEKFSDRIFSIQEVTDEPIDLGFFSHVDHPS